MSVDSSGNESNGYSQNPSISADGRYVAFESFSATNLVPGDTNNRADVFVHDRQTGQTTRISVGNLGVQGNNDSTWGTISADGRFVAFSSDASNLVAGDTNASTDAFVRDLLLGTTERSSVDSSGNQANAFSGGQGHMGISGDGNVVVFISSATNLVAGDTNGRYDVFAHERQTGITERVTVDSLGMQSNNDSFNASTNYDGRFVAFTTTATNLVPGDTNGVTDYFVHDRQTGTTERVSVDSSGNQGNNQSYGSGSSMSADGRFVGFASRASNLIPGDTNGVEDVFVRDRQAGTTDRVSVDSLGNEGNGFSSPPVLNAEGRFVVFPSASTNLVPGDTNGAQDVFVHDLQGSPADTTPPTVTCDPAPTFVLNEPGASVSATVEDAESGPQSPVVSASVSTAAAGMFTVALTGSDIAGNSTTVDCPYSVGYNFTGFFSPIDNPPIVNKANAGQGIPVKWQITDYNGVGVSDPASFVSVTSASTSCDSGDPTDAIETYSGSSGLQYLGDGNWQFNWTTPKSYAGKCRIMRLNLADGATDRTALFQFK